MTDATSASGDQPAVTSSSCQRGSNSVTGVCRFTSRVLRAATCRARQPVNPRRCRYSWISAERLECNACTSDGMPAICQ